MDEIQMRHPELGVTRTFPKSAQPFHAASGWVAVEPDADTPADPPPAGMSAEEAMGLVKPAKNAKSTTKDEATSAGTKE